MMRVTGLAALLLGVLGVGTWGISWPHHWEVTDGLRRSPSPDPPAWVVKAYEATVASGQ